MSGTSSNFRKLLRSLLDGAGRTADPVFPVADLRAIDPGGMEMLRREKVLVQAPPPTDLDHPTLGRVEVRKLGGQWFFIDSTNPSRDWQKAEPDEVHRFRFNHHGMLRWISRGCGTEDEIHAKGGIWTAGTTTVQGRWCRILYYPGPPSQDRLIACLRTIDQGDAAVPHLLLLPVAVSLESEELDRLASREIFVDFLYRLASNQGIDLESFRLPTLSTDGKPGYFFRRVGRGKSWEVGFNTVKPRAIPGGVAMDRIWLLLRNPHKEFTASAVTDELEGVSPDRKEDGHPVDSGMAAVRSTGTRARSLQDLTSDQQKEGAEILRELAQARKEDGEESREFREANEAWKHFQAQYGLTERFAGKAKRENDDTAKEAAKIEKSIDRWIKVRREDGMTDLADHLSASITRGTTFCYSPETLPPWQT